MQQGQRETRRRGHGPDDGDPTHVRVRLPTCCQQDQSGMLAHSRLRNQSPAEFSVLLVGEAHSHQRFENFRHVGRLGALEMALHPAKIVEMLGVTADFLA